MQPHPQSAPRRFRTGQHRLALSLEGCAPCPHDRTASILLVFLSSSTKQQTLPTLSKKMYLPPRLTLKRVQGKPRAHCSTRSSTHRDRGTNPITAVRPECAPAVALHPSHRRPGPPPPPHPPPHLRNPPRRQRRTQRHRPPPQLRRIQSRPRLPSPG